MTLFQPMWSSRPGPEELRRGWEEVQKAKALGPTTKREESFRGGRGSLFPRAGLAGLLGNEFVVGNKPWKKFMPLFRRTPTRPPSTLWRACDGPSGQDLPHPRGSRG